MKSLCYSAGKSKSTRSAARGARRHQHEHSHHRSLNKSKSARWKARHQNDGLSHVKAHKSLLLDPSKVGHLTNRHARYSSMHVSPQFNFRGKNIRSTAGTTTFFGDLDIDKAIHSLDNDNDSDEEEEDLNSFFSSKQSHGYTTSMASSLTIDAKQYPNARKSSQKVPSFKVESPPSNGSMELPLQRSVPGPHPIIKTNSAGQATEDFLRRPHSALPLAANPGNYGKIQPFQIQRSASNQSGDTVVNIPHNRGRGDSLNSRSHSGKSQERHEDSICTVHTMRITSTPSPRDNDNAAYSPMIKPQLSQKHSGSHHSNSGHRERIQREHRESASTEDSMFIPAPNYHKRSSLKSLDLIKAEKERKRQQRLEQKRESQSHRGIRPLIDMHQAARLRANSPSNHHRAYSSDVIGAIDFGIGSGDEQNGGIAMLKPGAKRHKLSIHDQQLSGAWRVHVDVLPNGDTNADTNGVHVDAPSISSLRKVSRNTMAPRPTAQSIIDKAAKNDEFILLFKQQLNEVKREQIEVQRKKGPVGGKRKSLPDFLSEIGSEKDHIDRLSTLRETLREAVRPHFGNGASLESLDENAGQSPTRTGSLSRSPESPRPYRTRTHTGSKHEFLLKDSGRDSGRMSYGGMEIEMSRSRDNAKQKLSVDRASKSMHQGHQPMRSRNKIHSMSEFESGSTTLNSIVALEEEWDDDVPRHGCCYFFCCCCICDALMCRGKPKVSKIPPPTLTATPSASHRSYDPRIKF